MICPNGHGQKAGNFCDQCGDELVPQPQESPNKPFEIFGNQVCPGCGFELNHNHQQFCPGCGHRLKWLCR